jgi:hypothetical protein
MSRFLPVRSPLLHDNRDRPFYLHHAQFNGAAAQPIMQWVAENGPSRAPPASQTSDCSGMQSQNGFMAYRVELLKPWVAPTRKPE